MFWKPKCSEQWHFGPPPPSMGTTERVLGMCSLIFVRRGTSSASQDCHSKEPKIGQQETADIHCLWVLEIGSLKSRCGQHRAPAETYRGESLLASPWLLLICQPAFKFLGLELEYLHLCPCHLWCPLFVCLQGHQSSD